MKFLYVLLFSFLSLQINAQKKTSRLDSLIEVSLRLDGVELVKVFNEVSWEYRNSNTDSALVYSKKSLKVAQNIGDKKSEASAYNSIATSYEAASKIDSALLNHRKSLQLKLLVKDTLGIGDTYNNIGIIYDIKGDYSKALENYFEALKIYEKLSDDFEKVPMVYVNIGIVYKKQKEYQKVLDYYSKALDIYKTNNFKIGEVITTGNIGSVLINLKKYNESITYLNRAKQLYDSLGYKRYVPYMEINIAIANDSLGNYKTALKYYKSSVNAFKNDNNLYELASAKINFGRHYKTTKDYLQAKKQLEPALLITRDNAFVEMENKALKQLAEVESKINNYKNAYTYLEEYSIQKDSIFETDKVKSLLELGVKYETQKKEREILQQRAEIAEQDLIIQRRNYQIYAILGIAIVLGLLGYLFYNQQKLKNIQLQKEAELKAALLKIETQNKLQEQRLRISRDLHDNIGAQLTFIISSIDNMKYGFDLPSNVETKLASISSFTNDTIYELRDTIWAMNKDVITFEDLQVRISNVINKANLSSQNIQFNFQVDEELNQNKKFSSIEGMNIYRIVQESINNALKYANATEINVVAKEELSKLQISIFDNGKGFDVENTERGNGLNNMKKRADEINAQLNITSRKENGTEIQLIV